MSLLVLVNKEPSDDRSIQIMAFSTLVSASDIATQEQKEEETHPTTRHRGARRSPYDDGRHHGGPLIDFNAYETRQSAFDLELIGEPLALSNVELRNDQWFRFEISEQATTTIDLEFQHDDGDLDLHLFEEQSESPLAEDTSAGIHVN